MPPEPSAGEPIVPIVPFAACPIRASLGVLGRKWALLVLRDIALLGKRTFTGILRGNPGMTPRILSMRLQDLRTEGLIERWENPENARDVRYRLTERGRDIVPVLSALIQFGARHHADRVFEDGRPREMEDLFPGRQETMLGPLAAYAATGSGADQGKRGPEAYPLSGGPVEEPGDVLQHEHEVILHLAAAVEGMAERIRTTGEVPEGDLGQALEAITEFADRCHHGKEEEVLFPALARASPEGAELTRRLTSDHKAMRKLVGVIREHLSRAAEDAEARRQLAKNLATYPRLLREHIRIEDDRLLAVTRESLSPEERARVAREFERVEAEEMGSGEHERYHALIHELADRYAP